MMKLTSEKTHLNLSVDKKLLETAKNAFLDKTNVISHQKYFQEHPNRLNLSALVEKVLKQLIEQQKIDPSKSLEELFNERADKLEPYFKERGLKAFEFWEEVKRKREISRQEHYDEVGDIIKEKEKVWSNPLQAEWEAEESGGGVWDTEEDYEKAEEEEGYW